MRKVTTACTWVGVRGLAVRMWLCVPKGWDDWKVTRKKRRCVVGVVEMMVVMAYLIDVAISNRTTTKKLRKYSNLKELRGIWQWNAVSVVLLVLCATGISTPRKLGDNCKLPNLRSAVFILKQEEIGSTRYFRCGPKGFAEY
jgi:hypothetical protein